MAVLKDSRVVLLGLVCGAGVVAQQAHRVNDPMELVVTPAQVADTAEKRADALALLERARQNTNLHAPGGAPYTLRISFNAADQGDGQLEETWFSGQDWSWTVRFGSFSLSRVIVGGRVWDDAPHNSIPLRLQTLRNAVFWPVVGNVAPDLIRTAAVNSNGVSLTCVLVSPAYTNAANAPRITEEREYCVDPASGLLQQYSPAPRMEMIYSYAGGPQFRGHTLPRTISVYEAGNRILTAQIEGIDDPGAPQPARATTGMSSGVVLSAPYRLRHFVPVPQGVEPFSEVLVHASVNTAGRVVEMELLQPDDATAEAALAALKKAVVFSPATSSKTPGVRYQREAYINVIFVGQQSAQ